MTRRTALIILLGILLGALGTRTYLLTARSLWFDEAFSWRLIQFPTSELLDRAIQDVHPPLYYLLLKGWAVVFGSSLVALRSFSVLGGLATVFFTYLFTAYAFRSRATGLVAATLMALAGFQIQYAWEARMYTLGTTLVLASSWMLLHAVRQPRQQLGWWLGYALTAVACAYTHYYCFFTIAGQALFVLGYIGVATRLRLGEIVQWRVFWNALLATLIAAGLYLPWIPHLLTQNQQVQAAFWIPPIGGWSIPDTFYRLLVPTPFIPNHQGVLAIFLAILPIIAIGVVWLGLVVSDRRSSGTRDASWLTLSLGVIPFICSIVLSLVTQSLYQDRFFIFAHLFIIIAIAVVGMRLPFRWVRRVVVTAVIIGFATAYTGFLQQLQLPQKPGARAAAAHIFQERTEDEPIFVNSPFIYFAIAHYAQENYDAAGVPKLYSASGELLHFAGGPILTSEDIVGPRELQSLTSGSVWVVDTTGFGEQPLAVPPEWQRVSQEVYPEVFVHQGDVVVSQYQP